MMMKKVWILTVLVLISSTMMAQISVRDENSGKKKKPSSSLVMQHKFDLGAGIGLDYGGIGVRFGVVPVKHLMLFGSAGYMFAGFGWQLGGAFHILPKNVKNLARPYVSVMYGTNAITLVTDENNNIIDEFSEVFTGPSFSAGVELRFGPMKQHGFDFELILPIRSDDYDQALEALKKNPIVEDVQEPATVQISLSYHYEF